MASEAVVAADPDGVEVATSGAPRTGADPGGGVPVPASMEARAGAGHDAEVSGAEPTLRWWLACLITSAALAVLFLVPEMPFGPGAPPLRPRTLYLTFPIGITADVVRLLLGLRLVALLSGPLRERLRRRSWARGAAEVRLPAAPVADVSHDAGWSWRVDGLLMLGVLGFTVAARWVGLDAINPDGVPFGSDWQTFLANARAAAQHDWTHYNPDKLPLYPWLTGALAGLLDGDYSRAGRDVSWLAMTFVAPFLYLALRLSLGRATAAGGCLLFAVSGVCQYYANAVTSYGMFSGLVILLAGMGAAALWTGSLVAYGATGVVLGLAMMTEVKVITVAAPMLGLMAAGLLVRGRSWRGRLAGPLLVAIPAWALTSSLHLLPLTFTSVERKLEIQTMDTVRFMSATVREGQRAEMQVVDLAEAGRRLPPVGERVRFNLTQMKQLAPLDWRWLLLLAGLGAVSPLVSRGRRSWRERLAGMGGPLFVGAVVASTGAAFAWLVLPKYLVHAVPFFLALAVHGAWCLAGWLSPPGAPASLRPIMAWVIVLELGVLVAPLDAVRPLTGPALSEIRANVLGSLPGDELRSLRAAHRVAGWLEAHVAPTTPLLMCDEATVENFLDRLVPVMQPSVAPATLCRNTFEGAPHAGRTWVVDNRVSRQLMERMAASPARFEMLYQAGGERDTTGTAFRVYRERGEAAPAPSPTDAAAPGPSLPALTAPDAASAGPSRP